jgi:outer membrane protein assembly factor BamB
MAEANLVYVGIKGTAVALDGATGGIVWQTRLKGGDFVHLVLARGNLLATTYGEIFCLDPATGEVRWKNPLKGFGLGLASIAARGGPQDAEVILLAEQERRRAAQDSAAAAPG